MKTKEIRKLEEASDGTYPNDSMAGNEMRVTIDINCAQLCIAASNGPDFLKVWTLAKNLLGDESPERKKKKERV